MLELLDDMLKKKLPADMVESVENDEKNEHGMAGTCEILENPRLLCEVIEWELDKHIVAERENKLSAFLISCGRLVLNGSRSSFNTLINSESGAGKDHILRKVLKLWDTEIAITRSRISETALTYWHNTEKEPEWTWDGKVLYLSDISNRILNSDVLKTYMSDESQATITIDNKAKDFEITGKPVLFLSSVSASVGHELLRRMPIMTLDESNEQTQRIIQKQLSDAATSGWNRNLIEYDKNLIKALAELQQVTVIIPFAERLLQLFKGGIIMRTVVKRFLDYIRASAALHQKQRKKEDGEVLAEGKDYDNAVMVLKATTCNSAMIPLTKRQTRILKLFTDDEHKQVSDLLPKVTFCSENTLRKDLDRLAESGFIEKEQDMYAENSKKPVMLWRRKIHEEMKIPSWKELSLIDSK